MLPTNRSKPLRLSEKSFISNKMAGLLLLFLACTGCSDSLERLREFCKLDAGITIYETVRAPGYYDSTTDCHHCWVKIIGSEYDTLEFCNPDKTHRVLGMGCYRLTKVKKTSGLCDPDIDAALMPKKTEEYVRFKEEYCIAAESIEEPELTVGLFLDRPKIHSADSYDLYRSHYIIKNLRDSRIYGEWVDYSVIGTGVGGSSANCNDRRVVGSGNEDNTLEFDKRFTNKVIKHP